MTTVFRSRLTLPALAAATSLSALAAPAQAQSVCSALTSTTFSCTNGGVTGTVDATATIGLPAMGVVLTDATDVLTASASGTLNVSTGDALTVIAPGGITVNAGSLNLVSTGAGRGAILLGATGTVNATLGTLSTTNDSGLAAFAGTGANVTTGAVTASNVTSASVLVPALGTLVGTGAAVRSLAGPASLTINGALNVNGTTDPLIGAFAYADAGTAQTTVNGAATVTGTGTGLTVGVAAVGNTGAGVTVTGSTLLTAPTGTALAALATTGTASVTCGNVTANGTTDVTGILASGEVVTVTCGNVTVTGTDSRALEAAGTTSVTANLGNVVLNGSDGTAILINDIANPGSVTLTTGTIATTGNNSPALVATAGSTLSARVGNVSTTGANAPAILLTAPGAITLQGTVGGAAPTVTTTGANSTAITVNGGTGAVSLTTGTVSATGVGSRGFDVTSAGDVTINSGQVTAAANGINTLTSGGAQLITVNGVQAGGIGVNAQTTGTGALTVTATAPVVSTNAIGIRAVGATGTVTVNAGAVSGATGGILAQDTGGGTVNVNATGGLVTATGGDAIRVDTLGMANVTVGSTANVQAQNGSDAIDVRGALGNTVTVNGIVGQATNATGYTITATGGPATVNIGATGNVLGRLQLTGGNDTVNNAGALSLYGTSDFGAGTDALSNTNALTLNGGASVTGLETLSNSGTTIVTAGTVTLTGTTFANPGQLIATGGATTLAGLTVFNNTGLITMVDGAANDSLTINGPYNGGANARLAVDVDGNLNVADRLVVNGNITGSTQIDVNLVGSAPLYNPTGVVIVDGSGTVGVNAFTLAPADAQIGFLNYGLRQVGNDTLLASTLDPSFTDVAMIGSMGRDMWYQSFDAYHDAIRGRHSGSLVSGHAIGIWGQLYESKDRYGDTTGRTAVVNNTTIAYSDQLRTHRRGAQVGLEFRGAGFVIGATGGYGWARNEDQPMVSRLRAEGYNYGAYALFGMANGLYGGLLVKRDDYHVDFANDPRGVSFRNDAHTTGVDGEIGMKFGTNGPIGFDLNAGLSWVKTDLDAWNQYGLAFDWQNDESMRGRVGARVLFPALLDGFVGAKVFHEFKDDGYLRVSGAGGTVADIDLAHRGTWVRLEAGIGASGKSGPQLTVWGDVGETKAFGGRVGFRF